MRLSKFLLCNKAVGFGEALPDSMTVKFGTSVSHKPCDRSVVPAR